MLELLTQSLVQSSWADRIGWVLIHSLWQFALVALVAVVLQRALQRCSATARYWVLLAVMFVTVALPVATWFSPWSLDAGAAAEAVGWAPQAATGSASAVLPNNTQIPDNSLPNTGGASGTPSKLQLEPQRLQPAPIGWASSWSLVKTRVQPWLPEVVLVWLAGVVLAAFRPLLSWYTVRRLRTLGVSPVADTVYRVLERTAKRLRLARAVDVLQSTLVKTPVVVGYFRPAVLLPLCVVAGLPEAQLELILAHELAHIRRHDYMINLLQTLVETLFFYHPAVWWLSRQIRSERENCCDDVAMATVGTRADYGRALLAIEELRSSSPALSLAAHGGSLLARIRRIAGCEPPPRIAGGGSILCVILVSIATLAAVTWAAAPAGGKPEEAPTVTENRVQPVTGETVVVGQVVDSAGKPVAGAQVAVVGRPRKPSLDSLLIDELQLLGLTKADAEGRFRLSVPKLSSATYFNETKVVAVAEGLNLGWYPIGEDVESANVMVKLSAEQTIHGRVLDVNGQPAADVKVHVAGFGKSLPGDFEGLQCWTPPSQLPFWPQPATTSHDGRFTLGGVDRGQILNVQVRDDRFAIDWMQLGSAGQKDAHVTVSPSGEVTLSPPPARIFEGQITYDDTHQPVANARVEIGASVNPMTCIMNMAGRTDARGRFRLNPYSGSIFYISAYAPDGEPYLSYQKEIKLADAEQPPQIEIALPRGVLLRGTISEKSSGEPVAGAAVKYKEQSRPPYRPDRILPDHAPPSVRGDSHADGVYQIAIPPGQGVLFVQGPGNDYVRQTINTWDFGNDRQRTIALRHYVSANALLDVKPSQDSVELNFAIQRGRTVRGSIVGPEDRPVGDVLILSRHFLGVTEDTWNGGKIRVKNGQFELHGSDPDASVPFYFLDPEHQTGATVEISGKSADNGPLVVHLQPCGQAVARFVDREGKPKIKYRPCFQILVSPGPFQVDDKRTKTQVSSDQDFVANFDREHYWNGPLTDDDGRCTFPALIPGATYRIDIMNKLGDWDERDFSVKSGETLQLPDIVIPEPASKSTTQDGAKAKEPAPAPPATADGKAGPAGQPSGGADAWQPGQTLDFRVINAKTKEPLPGVKLDLQCHGRGINFQDIKVYTTDAQGRAELKLPDLRPDAVRVYPSKAGFVPLRVYWGDDLPSPKFPKSVTVPIEPGTLWGGVVQNEEGEPIPNVKVNVRYWESSSEYNPHLRVNIDDDIAGVTTDKDGRWRMDILPATFTDEGPRLFFTHPDYVSDHLQRGCSPWPVTERPSYKALQDQTAVIVLRKGTTITGRVTDEAGKPIPGASVCNQYDCYDPDPLKISTITDNDGQFRLSGLSHRQNYRDYFFTVQAAGYAPVFVEVSDADSGNPIDIKLTRGQSVQGQVVDENGRPIEGVSIKLDYWLGRPRQFYLKTTTNAAGKFRIDDAPLDRTEYDIEKKGFITVRGPLLPSATDYTVTLRPPLWVAGSIVDSEMNKPLAKCRVIKGWDYEDGRNPAWETAIGLPAREVTNGQYECEFTQEHGTRIRVEAEGYMPAESRMFKPGNGDNGHVTYDFRLKKAAPMSGTVLGRDDAPLAGAEVFIATQQFNVRDRKPAPPVGEKRRTAGTDEKGRFEFPPEVEPFYLVVLHDQGFAAIDEKQFAENARIHIQPWTEANQNFTAERRPSTGKVESPTANAKKGLTVRVVDQQGKPVEGAHVATNVEFRVSANEFRPYEPDGWTYFPNVLSDTDGMAQIADPYNRCVVARHVEKKLVAVQSVTPEQVSAEDVLTLTMQPQCEVTGKLTAEELAAHNRKLTGSNVNVYLTDGVGRPMSCMSNKGDYHFYLPPGTYSLDAYGTDTQHVRKIITIEPGQETLEVELIDLPPEGLVLLEGKPAPELREIVAWKNGGPIKLSDLRGKVVILTFSMQWSAGRYHGIVPELFSLYDKYHDQGLVVIEVRLLGFDSNATLDERIAEIKPPFWRERDLPIPIALAPQSIQPTSKSKRGCPALDDYELNGTPRNVLIDRQGRVVGRFEPHSTRDNAVLEKVLNEKPGEQPTAAAATETRPPVQSSSTATAERPPAADTQSDSGQPAKESSSPVAEPKIVGYLSFGAAFRMTRGTRGDMLVLHGYDLLMRQAVVDEVKITAEQKKKLREVQSEHLAAMSEFFRQRRDLPEAERLTGVTEWQREQRREIRKQVEEILAPEQMETLNHLVLQSKAAGSLSDGTSGLWGKLQLTEEQQDKLRTLRKEMGNRVREEREEKTDKMLAVLNPQQRAQLREEAFGPDWPDSNPQAIVEVGGDVGRIYLPGLDPYPDVTKEDVQKELGMSPQQHTQVRELLGGAADLAEKLVAEWQKLSPVERKKMEEPAASKGGGAVGGGFRSEEERKKWEAQQEEKARKARQERCAERQQNPMVKANAELVRQFESILNPEQLAHFKDMAFRNRVAEGLHDQIILKKIGANDHQMDAIEQLFDESIEQYPRLNREMGGKMLKILTPAQQETLRGELLSAVP